MSIKDCQLKQECLADRVNAWKKKKNNLAGILAASIFQERRGYG